MADVTLQNMIDLFGLCQDASEKLSSLYPDGTVHMHPDELAAMEGVGLHILWAAKLTTQAAQIELAQSWFDRAMGVDTPAWLATVRALPASPDAAVAAGQIVARLAAMKVAMEAEDVRQESLEGVAYGMARLALDYANGEPSHSDKVAGAFTILGCHCARAIGQVETTSHEEMMSELKGLVLAKVNAAGIVLP